MKFSWKSPKTHQVLNLSQSPVKVPLNSSVNAQSMKVNDADQVAQSSFSKVHPEVSPNVADGGRASDAALSLGGTDRTHSINDGSDEEEDVADINLTENSVRGPDQPGIGTRTNVMPHNPSSQMR